MTTETLTLADFLLARIAEDEAMAEHVRRSLTPQRAKLAIAVTADNGDGSRTTRDVTAYDPARVLAECEAKRRIVELHGGAHNCVTYIDPDDNRDCSTLGALASVYADHADYRDDWKP